MTFASVVKFARAIGFRWTGARTWERGAAMAFFALLSLSPLFLLLLSLLDKLFGENIVRGEIYLALVRGLGAETATAIQALVLQPGLFQGNFVTITMNIVLTAVAAAALFRHMQTSLGVIWTAPHHERRPFLPRYISGLLRSFFAMGALTVVAVGVFLLVAAAILTGPLVQGFLFSGAAPTLWPMLTTIMGLLGALLVFATLYLTLSPERPSSRRLAVALAVVLAGLVLSRTLMSVFAETHRVFSLFGAGSAVIYLLFWCFFLSQLFLFGAVVSAVATDDHRH